jgi:outer membrane protein assembly factor BamD (BamD/ComL family)
MSSGQWTQAAVTYRQLRRSHPGSAQAKTVLVALGQLQLDRPGQPAAAKQSFSAYLSAGGGALSQEASTERFARCGN